MSGGRTQWDNGEVVREKAEQLHISQHSSQAVHCAVNNHQPLSVGLELRICV